MSDNNNEQQLQQTPPVEPNPVNIESKQRTQQLTKEEKHKIHNRACTLKQPINFSTSSITHERTLYIGIKDASKLETYKIQIQNLFTREHYKQYQYEKR
ncbi:unnamed protein product, partial [Rotaria sordida]